MNTNCTSQLIVLIALIVLLVISILLLPWFIDEHSALAARSHTNTTTFLYDPNGVPYYNYGKDVGIKRNPLFTANEVVHHFIDYNRTNNETSRNIAINNANWLVNNMDVHGNYSILEYEFPFPRYEMEPPWRSAMAQAKAADALTKAHEITNNQTYLDAAKSLLNSLFVEVKDGGVTYKTPTDGWWYEEYADDGANETKVLNGMISSVLSIHEYYKYTNDTDAKLLYDQGILALKKDLPLYDKNGYSYYDIQKMEATSKYHMTHVDQLEQLLNVAVGEEKDVFRKYYDKWRENIKPIN